MISPLHQPSVAPEIRTVHVTRYVTPLREGGSLPGLVEADDEFLYVVKFRGAGQGVKALIAELIAGELARALGLRVPEIVFAELDPILAKTEADEEIQDLLKGSGGLNLALHYLSGAITFDALVTTVDAKTASLIVWLDCLITNVDRTPRNTNMLMWHKELWLIDHGAAFYFHHSWQNLNEQGQKPFVQVKDHVLLPQASDLPAADVHAHRALTPALLQAIVALIPEDWLLYDAPFETAEAHRQAYLHFLESRLAHSHLFVKEAQDAREALI